MEKATDKSWKEIPIKALDEKIHRGIHSAAQLIIG